MALDAGVMSVTLEFAKDLKDADWFGKQDPYCIIRIGGQTFRTRTAVDGGRNPVWNETFRFNVINENNVDVEIKDEDVGKDDLIGTCTFSLAKARESGSDRIQAPVVSKKSRKQRGFLSIALSWEPNKALKPTVTTQPAAPHYHYMPHAALQPAYYAAPPVYAAPATPMAYYPSPAPPAGYYAPAQAPTYAAQPPPAAAAYPQQPQQPQYAFYPAVPVGH
ncbi:hypothetical protein CHLRE_11g467593v5 [Chlamydomonas reinhardtii]|uniref:Uncharacterized protein n=1 Tax=Chlamydomonas reinhardtii TaxID=3055 RepID=A8JA62_CHLRE|nr:uncharacterized protein CHLRE_11g467593v5 [Chlamydomonas reinhardtii]PNW76446.1 hypothetical protein CHLRE_11g467593v5 [Chlamydomonas reinhardtii]|eukprot:XP_001698778.1 predicted protein [Chlamydomonas reinhardtii]